MIESIVLPSLSTLITNTELCTEQFSPGMWYYNVGTNIGGTNIGATNLGPVSSDSLKDLYEMVWNDGWI